MSLPLEFSFDGAAVRVVLVEGEPWWVAADVALSLEYRMASDMTRSLDEDERGTQIVRTPSGDQEMLIINESGLYSAILRSRKASAKRFKKWVTAEVLPSIRKHGAYVMPPVEAEPASAPMSAHVEADQIVSAGRVFRALFGTARSMGMARRLAATRANQAAQRATGIDLAAELGASEWLDGPDLPTAKRVQYELQQRIRSHLVANDWPQGFGSQQVIEALGLVNDRGTQSAVGQCLQLLGYKRVRLPAKGGGSRPWGYVLADVARLA
ncbi:BRO-N domain-containing protein [Pseudomonas indica]|uniref:BRO family, N-terminal domain n=1 Tax=Pseudomonas indica TaxID=137658 RepID=A0A1G8V652_9PSED|nr:BRO family protein [Pseudomonas indica]SDJ61334.1 BRO family, N-terminal domain [Pseudomonas indica]